MQISARHGEGKSRRAVAAVELVCILPVLLLLALGATDFGRVIYTYLVVSNAARCGAEYGCMHKVTPLSEADWQTNVRAAVDAEVASVPGYEPQQVEAHASWTPETNGLYSAAVEVTYPFKMVVKWPGIPSPLLLHHRVEMHQMR
jgi:Flp pilus assembly protein TadG